MIRKFVYVLLMGLLALVMVACDTPPTPDVAEEPQQEPAPTEEIDRGVPEQPEESAESAEEPAPEASDAIAAQDITGVVWQWADLVETQPAAQSVVPNPQLYTITFGPNGLAFIQADCNNIQADYVLEGDQLSMTLGPTTQVFCGEESLDTQYTMLLAEVQRVSAEDGRLFLHTAGDAATMGFNNGGAAPPAEGAEGGQAPVDSENNIQGIVWMWEEFQDTAGANNIVVDDPTRYTITFGADGAAQIMADCNIVLGTYMQDGSSLEIGTMGASTLAFCGEDSLDQLFLQRLSEVRTFVKQDGKLFMNLMADAGNMVFADGGVPGAAEVGLDPRMISLDTGNLPYSWQANLVAATPYDESQPPGPQGLPAHMVINFGVGDVADSQPGDPIMYLIPVANYIEMWDEAGNETVEDLIRQIYQMTAEIPFPSPLEGIPVLPVEQVGGVNDVALYLQHLQGVTEQSASKNGYRFVGRFAQDANPITQDGLPLQYVYQGFTNDGQYLVAFFNTVNSNQLPTNAEVSEEFNEAQSEEGGAQAYLEQQVIASNQLLPEAWTPNLSELDALVASLQIEGMPSHGLQDHLWTWIGNREADGSTQPVSNSQNYTVIFNADETLSYQADCNNGNGVYEASGGVVGSLATQLGATTLAACEPQSRGDELAAALAAVQDYRVLPTGRLMELHLPAGGPILVFASLGPADAVPPDGGQPPVEIPTPEPGDPTGRVIAPSGANVRTGPGLEYQVIGVAPFGAEGEVIGQSADGLWWVTPVQSAPNGQGWVSKSVVQTTNTDNVPVISAPAPPPATPIPTPPPNPDISFTTDRTSISQGECATLTWDVENVQAVWIYPRGERFTDYPVTGSGTQRVCPTTTTTYEMRVQHVDGSIELRQITINVSSSNPLSGSNWMLSSMNVNQVPVPGTSLTVAFGTTGTISGTGGCNSYSGPYSVHGSSITIGPLTSTQAACSEDIMDQEQLFFSLLQSAAAYNITSQLTLFGSSGAEILRFNPN